MPPVHLNGEEVRAVHVPGGHTDGDGIVHFTRSNAVHLGDDYFSIGFPFVDLDSGGSVKAVIEVLEKLIDDQKFLEMVCREVTQPRPAKTP